MHRYMLPLSVLFVAAMGYFVFPAEAQQDIDPQPVLDSGDEVIIAGKVTAATDEDGDGKKDTFVINTGGTNTKTVSNLTETKHMGLIAVGDHVEIKVEVNASSNKIVDVIKIGE